MISNGRTWVFAAVALSALAGNAAFAQTNTNSSRPWDAFATTNGGMVHLGMISFDTNSPLNSEEFKEFFWRREQLFKLQESAKNDTNAFQRFADGAWELVRQCPKYSHGGYQVVMNATVDLEFTGQLTEAREQAHKLIASGAGDDIKHWAEGFLNRVDSMDKPVALQFTAVDGRDVDAAKMKGKVVLVLFWDDDSELAHVKPAYDKYHGQGFEVFGIYSYSDRDRMDLAIRENGEAWPQYFDGQFGKLYQNFGVPGTPYSFLLDEQGRLRFDHVRADDSVHPKGDTKTFEEKITELLSEK